MTFKTTATSNIFSEQPSESNTVDQDLFSRQLYIFDMNSMSNIQSTYIIVIGLECSALEILKNIVLAGLINIELYDPRLIMEDDMSFGFYIKESDIGKRRDLVYKKILEENILHSVNVKVHTNYSEYNHQSFENILKTQNICLVNEGTIQFHEDINQFCRLNRIRYIGVKTKGFFSFVFNDLIEFVSKDVSGEPIINGYGIWNSNLLDISERKDFVVGMKLKIKYESENTENDELETLEVLEIINQTQLKVNKRLENEKAIFFEEIKQPMEYLFESLTDVLRAGDSNKILCESWEIDKKQFLLQLFRSECIFNHRNSRLPKHSDKDEIINILKERFNYEEQKQKNYIIEWFLKGDKGAFYPILSVVGGFVGQEILKAASKKYSPLNQVWLYECFTNTFENILYLQEMLLKNGIRNKQGENNEEDRNKEGENKRVKLLKGIIGAKNIRSINKTSPFLIGVGAIGCELLKNFAMLNISNIRITDSDSIETSNLSRQFLFNKTDVGKMKSEAVKRSLQIINEEMKITNYTKLIQDEGFDSSLFMEDVSFFSNALDNLEARLYVDGLSMKYGKSLFDAGTLGTKGSTSCSLKGISENWGAQQDPKETSIPVCTLRSFPSTPTHSIEFGLDEFKMFNEHLSEKKKKGEKILQTGLCEVSEILNILSFPVSNEFVVFCSLKWFRVLFFSNIEVLKSTYPRNHVNTDGTPFWNSLKRYPSSIEVDFNNDMHKLCLLSMCNVFMQCCYKNNLHELCSMGMNELENILISLNKEVVLNMIDKFIRLEKEDTEDMNINSIENEFLKEILQFLKIKNIKEYLEKFINLEEVSLEKDDDNNFHINLIHNIATLRCINYRIKEPEDFLFTKGIAGKIIPAFSTTTGMISGLITIEMVKYVLYKEISKDLKIELEDLEEYINRNGLKKNFDIKESFKNSFIDLGQPWIGSADLLAPQKYETIKGISTCWTNISFTINPKETLFDFIKIFEEKYKKTIGDILLNGDIIFSTILINEERKSLLHKPLLEICKKREKYIFLEVVLDDEEDIEVPNVKIMFEH